MSAERCDSRASSALPRRVLLVDRDRHVTENLRVCLEINGFDAWTAQSMPDALEAVSESDARVVLLDIGLGSCGGIDLIRALTDRCPQIRCIMTADPDNAAEAVRTLQAGACAWLRKPVDHDELLATLARCFDMLQLTHDKTMAEAELARMKQQSRHARQRVGSALETLPHTGQGYRHLMAYLSEVFYRTDRDGTITTMSPSVTNMLGYAADAVVGMNMARDLYVDRRDREHLLEKLARTGTVSGEEVVLKHRDGHGVLVSVTARVAQDADGRPNGVEGLFNDITQRRRIEDERTRLAAAVDQASELIFITDTEGTIQYVNPSFSTITGYSREEAIGQKPSLLKSGKHDAAFYAALWGTITSGTVWKGRLVNRRKDGTLYEEEATITPIRDQTDRIVSYVAVKRDVTREVTLTKQLRQAQKMEAIGTLAGGIAHDFNNILAAIIGYTELARMDMVEDTPLMENINKVLSASYRARDLVAQILAFSRQTEQTLKPVNISAIVKEVFKLLRASLPATIEIRQRILMTSATILADVTQIHQVLMNICTNAGHAMRSKGGILEVYLGEARGEFEPSLPLQHLTASDHLCLAIRDTGHGMPPDVIERIFDPYFTTKKKEEGTGLGLAVVHGIVTSHNGHITVESTPGEGTTFKIYFPIISAKVFDRQQTLGAKLPGGMERVMLIDDEVDIVQVNRQALERLGYRVAAYTDSRTAVADFESDPEGVDLLITDMTMPGLTGDHVVRAVLTRRPDLPVIMCTGFSETINKEKALGMGVRRLMMKPLSLGALARTIRELLD